MTKKQKHQFLLENGWWCHYNPNCWYETEKDTQYVNDKGEMVGFRPIEEGITLEDAFKQCILSIAKKVEL